MKLHLLSGAVVVVGAAVLGSVNGLAVDGHSIETTPSTNTAANLDTTTSPAALTTTPANTPLSLLKRQFSNEAGRGWDTCRNYRKAAMWGGWIPFLWPKVLADCIRRWKSPACTKQEWHYHLCQDSNDKWDPMDINPYISHKERWQEAQWGERETWAGPGNDWSGPVEGAGTHQSSWG